MYIAQNANLLMASEHLLQKSYKTEEAIQIIKLLPYIKIAIASGLFAMH